MGRTRASGKEQPVEQQTPVTAAVAKPVPKLSKAAAAAKLAAEEHEEFMAKVQRQEQLMQRSSDRQLQREQQREQAAARQTYLDREAAAVQQVEEAEEAWPPTGQQQHAPSLTWRKLVPGGRLPPSRPDEFGLTGGFGI